MPLAPLGPHSQLLALNGSSFQQQQQQQQQQLFDAELMRLFVDDPFDASLDGLSDVLNNSERPLADGGGTLQLGAPQMQAVAPVPVSAPGPMLQQQQQQQDPLALCFGAANAPGAGNGKCTCPSPKQLSPLPQIVLTNPLGATMIGTDDGGALDPEYSFLNSSHSFPLDASVRLSTAEGVRESVANGGTALFTAAGSGISGGSGSGFPFARAGSCSDLKLAESNNSLALSQFHSACAPLCGSVLRSASSAQDLNARSLNLPDALLVLGTAPGGGPDAFRRAYASTDDLQRQLLQPHTSPMPPPVPPDEGEWRERPGPLPGYQSAPESECTGSPVSPGGLPNIEVTPVARADELSAVAGTSGSPRSTRSSSGHRGGGECNLERVSQRPSPIAPRRLSSPHSAVRSRLHVPAPRGSLPDRGDADLKLPPFVQLALPQEQFGTAIPAFDAAADGASATPLGLSAEASAHAHAPLFAAAVSVNVRCCLCARCVFFVFCVFLVRVHFTECLGFISGGSRLHSLLFNLLSCLSHVKCIGLP